MSRRRREDSLAAAAGFLAGARLVIVAGKGGVGKTTVTAAVAVAAAHAGLSSLVVEVEGKGELAALFGRERLAYDDVVLADGVRGRALSADQALLEYLRGHGLSRISNRLLRSGALDLVATAAPGIKDILLLGKVKQLERVAAADVIVLDTPAAGHAMTFLQSPRGLLDAVQAGPISAQAREVLAMLTDPARSRVMLVTLPEETPVNEALQTANRLEDLGVSLASVVVNGVYPIVADLDVEPRAAATEAGVSLQPDEAVALAAAAAFRRRRTASQEAQIGRLAALSVPTLRLPFRFGATLTGSDVEALAAAFSTQVAALPAARR